MNCNLRKDVFLSLRFLTEYPDYKLRFTEFKNIASLDQISTRSVHVKRMLAALENSVSSLDDGETFSEYALELGRRHAALNVKPTTSQVNRHTVTLSQVIFNIVI